MSADGSCNNRNCSRNSSKHKSQKNSTKHGGPGKVSTSIREFNKNAAAIFATAAAVANTRDKYKTRWSEEIDSHLGVCVNNAAAIIATAAAAANTRAKIQYETRWAGTQLILILGVPKKEVATIATAAAVTKTRAEMYCKTLWTKTIFDFY